MLTTIALALLNIVLVILLVRREAEMDEARRQARLDRIVAKRAHEDAETLRQIARKEYRLAEMWRERAEADEIPEPFREGWGP